MNGTNLKIEGLDELNNILKEWPTAVQNRIVVNAMKASGNLIIKQAKTNLRSVFKGKSKTNYQNFNSSFSVQAMSSRVGVKAGIKNFKYRFIEYGTNGRFYKQKKSEVKHETGKIMPTKFFASAVDSTKDQAVKNIQDNIVQQLEKTVIKFGKKFYQ